MHAKNISILSALMAIGLALTGCDSKTSESNVIVIATAGPMTGQYATFGVQMRRGAEQAVKDINAAGGVLGKKLKLEIGDDQCDPKQAVAVANQMVNKGPAVAMTMTLDSLAWRIRQVRRMVGQYPWLFEKAGPLNWRER